KLGIDRISKPSRKNVKVKWANPDIINDNKFLKTLAAKSHKHEQRMQIQIATYLKLKHPEIIFYSDVASGCKLTIGQAVINRKMQYSRALPDMFIAEIRKEKGGLFLEFKKDINEICCKDGTLRKDKHIIEQNEMLIKLRNKGYSAHFACGFDDAINIIENYLN
ncbi:MAG: hypothetical protein KGL95_10105, partial [Patescibacteria group bacterium]|nr:hypothetical protein [Patescibacteria group bacterium]